ncbi:MAG: hypothetical protein IJ109_09475 [Firmicutes bacterium]|nr:hypothetical protein [Bacillota bacterium]
MKLKPDFKSIKFKTFMYFVLFAGFLMLLLWSLQVLFLNNFYGAMKINQTKMVAQQLQDSYHSDQESDFRAEVADLSRSYDLHIYVISYYGGEPALLYAPTGDTMLSHYGNAIVSMYETIVDGNGADTQISRIGRTAEKDAYAYATVINKEDCSEDFGDACVLYIFSPLRPVTSTSKIMTTILIYVTIISLILAFFMSLYLSARITRPIRKITSSAERLARGEYGIVFKGGHYTEINNLADTLTSASIELEKSDLIQKDLIANVSHDLRTPLTMIRSYAEMIRDLSGDDPQKRQQHLQVIIDESKRLNDLVEDLLTVSRMQSGKISIEKKDFSISEAVLSIARTYRVLEVEQGYRFQVNCPANFIVNGDEEKLKQVVSNLVTNAMKFCGEDKQINIALQRRGRLVRVSVEDHGSGIAAEDLDHIWERYYRSSSNTVRASEGSGLGLSIVKEILTLHKATFGVDSTLGQGSTFWFELDLVRSEKLLPAPPDEEET